nr:cytochrome c [Lysobacter antarcticus]
MRLLTIAAALALTLATAPAAAQEPSDTSASAQNGYELTYTCQGCHGIDGYKNAYPNYHVPKLGGQSVDYLVNALTAYQNGTRSHPTMRAQAKGFSDQDIADIAAFLSNVK